MGTDGRPNDSVFAPILKAGNYRIQVLPEPDALPTDSYSLEVEADATTITLAQNVFIRDIPSQGYGIRSTGAEIIQASPVDLMSAMLWVGLKNSDAVGLRLDLRAEIFLNETKVGEGQLNNVASGSSGFNNAKLNTIPLTLFAPVNVVSGDDWSITLSVRRTCSGGGHNSGTPRLWYNGQPIDSGSKRDAGTRFGAVIDDTTNDFFLREGFVLSTSAGSSKKFIDVPVDNKAPCPNRPFKPFGSWSVTVP